MDDAVLDRARAGDERAFEELVEPHRRELLVYCYRSLGSLTDAEDVLQEVLVAAWRALDRFDGRALRAWLYRIATNRCLNHRRDASRRPRPAPRPDASVVAGGIDTADDPWWLEPFPDDLIAPVQLGPEARYDLRESIALSFVAGLQHLPPQQRAVLLLRDVLGYPAADAATILDVSPAAINSTLIRARSGFRPDRAPEQVPLPRSAEEAAIVDGFVDAFTRGDLLRVVQILREDARLSMPPEPIRCVGRDAVVDYLRWRGFWGPDISVRPTRANGQPALVYRVHADGDARRAHGVMVLSLAAGRVSAITRFGESHLVRFPMADAG